ncbi:MAG: polyprenyl synthetase family protein [Polyangiaceae bacterium]
MAPRTTPVATTSLTELLDRWSREESARDTRDTPCLGVASRALRDRALLQPLREFLGRPGKMLRARLVEVGFRVAGGSVGAHPPELPLVIEALHAGSLIVDDIEDQSDERRGSVTLHKLYGVPVALNAANWLYFWPQVLLSRIALSDAARLRAHDRLAGCLLRCHEGQAIDLTVRVCDLPESQVHDLVQSVACLKTASLLELATALGAIAAGADSSQVDAIARFGREVGIGLQMLDDLSGVHNVARRHKAIEDLRQGRATWIWAWLAQDADKEAYRRLLDELTKVMDGADAEPLIERIRLRLGERGLRAARLQLDAAIEALRAAGEGEEGCCDFRRELDELERLYVGG